VRAVVPKSNANLLLSLLRQCLPASPPDVPASSEPVAISLPPNPTLPPAEALSTEDSSPEDPETKHPPRAS